MQKRSAYFSYILLAIFVLAGVLYLARPLLIADHDEAAPVADAPAPSAIPESSAPATAPAATSSGITKEGVVAFLRGGQQLRKIDVEIAENDAERAKGLMFRPYLSDSVGMLFVFEYATPQSFWMKNTMISLDIIYVDSGKKNRFYSEKCKTLFGRKFAFLRRSTIRSGSKRRLLRQIWCQSR